MLQLEKEEISWLAGLLEGEGSFLPQKEGHSVVISLQMTDEDVVSKVATMFEISYCQPKKQKEHHKQSYKLSLRGSKALEVMKLVKPYMGKRRSEKIQECIESYCLKTNRKINIDDYNSVYNMYKEGIKPDDIGKKFGITKWRVYQIIRKFK